MEIVVILDNIRSALNVGAILRTCDGLGVREIYLVGISPTPLHPKVSKTSLGAEEYVKWKHVKDISEAITKLKKEKASTHE